MAVYKTAIPAEPEPTQTFRMIQKGMVIKMSGVTKVEKRVLSSDGIHQLAGWVYLPDGPARGLLQVVHGMTEYIGRYDSFMTRMAGEGYICFGYDHLGHGYTASHPGGDGPDGDTPSELGFIASRDGWLRLAEDVGRFAAAVREVYGRTDAGETLPWFLLGHSMGSFIVRVSSARFAKPDKLILMGTGGPNPASGAGLALVGLTKCFRGERYISPLIDKLTFGSYNSHFREENDPLSWLTTDRTVRDRYREDPLCTFKFTVSAMGDLIRLNRAANSRACFKALGGGMPVLLLSGRDDPVGAYGKGVTIVYNRLKRQGAEGKLVLYDHGRHEILNDTCREAAVGEILAFLAAPGTATAGDGAE